MSPLDDVASETERLDASERSVHGWGIVAALVVLLGVAGELGTSEWHWTTLLFMGMVVVGVAGEIVADVLQTRLSRRVSEQQKENETALRQQIANERAARLDIETRLAPRRLSEEDKKRIAAELSSQTPHEVVVVSRMFDAEAEQFARDFGDAFRRGGWKSSVRTTYVGLDSGIVVGEIEGNPAAGLTSLREALARCGVTPVSRTIPSHPAQIAGELRGGFVFVIVGVKP